MSTTTTKSPDFASLPFSMGKSPSSLYMPPSTSAYGHHASNGTSGNAACSFAANSEFTNLTPMMSGNSYQNSMSGDSSNPSSASSSRTRLVNLGHDDSGLSGFSSTDTSVLVGYGSPLIDMKAEEDLEAMPRDRCNTWPMRRSTVDINGQTSPMIHDRIPEEDIYDSGENLSHSTITNRLSNGALNSPQSNSFNNEFTNPLSMSPGSPHQEGSGSPEANGSTKNKTTRRNAWGNLSYADLITQAILSSPDKRLTLSQVYEWMVTNVSYFRDKGDSNSSAGWKNSIRHNLSLHNRFMRVQNEGAGKSSWWVINPDAKPGRNPRRRAQTMEGATKASMEKNRRKVRSKRSDLGISLHSANNSAIGSAASIMSTNHVYNDQEDALNANFDTFRPRTQSNISAPTNNRRMSPARYDEFDFPPCWTDALTPGNSNPELSDIMGRTDQMRLNSDATDYRKCAVLKNPNPMVNGLNGRKIEIKPEMSSPHHSIAPPPPYTASQTMPPMSNHQMMRRGPPNFNPTQQQHMQSQGMQVLQQQRMSNGMSNGYYQSPIYMSNGGLNSGIGSAMPDSQPQQNPNPWQHPQSQMQLSGMGMPPTTSHHNPPSLFDRHSSNGALPVDLENLNLPDSSMMDMEFDVEAVLRHEMAHNHDGSINFEL